MPIVLCGTIVVVLSVCCVSVVVWVHCVVPVPHDAKKVGHISSYVGESSMRRTRAGGMCAVE